MQTPGLLLTNISMLLVSALSGHMDVFLLSPVTPLPPNMLLFVIAQAQTVTSPSAEPHSQGSNLTAAPPGV